MSEFERFFYKQVGNAYDKSGRQTAVFTRTSRRAETSSWAGTQLMGALIAGRQISGMAARRRRPGRTS